MQTLEAQQHQWIAVWPWGSYLTSLNPLQYNGGNNSYCTELSWGERTSPVLSQLEVGLCCGAQRKVQVGKQGPGLLPIHFHLLKNSVFGQISFDKKGSNALKKRKRKKEKEIVWNHQYNKYKGLTKELLLLLFIHHSGFPDCPFVFSNHLVTC